MPDISIPYHQLPSHIKPDKSFKIVSKEKYIKAHMNEPIHRHGFFELLFIWDGSGEQFKDFASFPISNNSVSFIHPNQVHQANTASFDDIDILIFNAEYFETEKSIPIIDDLLFPLQNFTFKLSDSQVIILKGYLQLIKEEYYNDADYGILSSMVYVILRLLHRIYKMQLLPAYKEMDPRTVRFQKLLEASFTNQHLPSFYASALNISVKHLNTLVKKDLGKSASMLLKERIMLEIKRLLAYSKLTHKEIAFKLGFKDPYYMSHYFKKYTGKSPRNFKG